MPNDHNISQIDTLMSDMLKSLEIIKSKLPNGELKIIQEKITKIEEHQSEQSNIISQIRTQLSDPEDGIVVRVNKNTTFRKKYEAEEKERDNILSEHKELMSFKSTTNRVLWILFTAVAGLIVSAIFKLLQ